MAQTNAPDYDALYSRAAQDPLAYWEEQARQFAWFRPWDSVREVTYPFAKLLRQAPARRRLRYDERRRAGEPAMMLRRANPDDLDPEGLRAMPAERQPHDPLYDELYDRYARPLEAEHRGEFIIIAPDGRYVLGDSPTLVLEMADRQLGRGHEMYRIGFRYVGEALASEAP